MSPALPTLYVGGDPRHGVVAFARAIASALPGAVACETPTDDGGPLHVHFTDRLWGRSPEAAADALDAVADRRRLTLTLHDVPQASDGADRLPRRVAAYRRVAERAAGLVVGSAHEACLLRETGVLGTRDPDPAVIPLPAAVPLGPPPAGAAPARREVALLGWIYPGKGHAEAIAAVAGLAAGPPVAVTALGAPSPGHEPDLDALHRDAAERGVAFAASGWLPEAELVDRCRAAAVGLAAHTHVSASASINAWIAAGRRPLVADSRYAREIDALRPGTVTRYDPAGLREAIAAALADPASTWLAPGLDTRPHLAEVAAAYRSWWAER